jgi:hypothetical protein
MPENVLEVSVCWEKLGDIKRHSEYNHGGGKIGTGVTGG